MRPLLVLCMLLTSSSIFGVTAGKVWRVPPAGTKPSWGPVDLADTTNAVTGLLPRTSLASLNCGASSASNGYSNSSATFSDVTGIALTLTTIGGIVRTALYPQDGTNGAYVTYPSGGGGVIKVVRDGVDVCAWSNPTVSTAQDHGPYECWDAPSPGAHLYKYQARSGGAGGSISVFNWRMLICEYL